MKARAVGRGGALVLALAPHLAEAVARGPHQHGPCPRCGGRDRFRPFADFEESGAVYCNQCGQHLGDVFAALQWANDWTFPEALTAVAEYLGMVPYVPGVPRRPAAPLPPVLAPDPEKVRQEAEEAARRRAAMVRAWSEARPIRDGDPAALYLAGRLLDFAPTWPECLRCHPGMVYHEGAERFGPFPVMPARIDGSDGRMVGIHRTYLTTDGRKAPVVNAKKIMPPDRPGATRGGAVRLFEHGPVLAVAEGIETALAVHKLTALPTWATVSAGGMEAVVIPREVREVVICADHDENGRGQQAARRLAARMLNEGRKVRVAIPPDAGFDWADVWALEAEHGGEVRP